MIIGEGGAVIVSDGVWRGCRRGRSVGGGSTAASGTSQYVKDVFNLISGTDWTTEESMI
jgi:hypothetical protein